MKGPIKGHFYSLLLAAPLLTASVLPNAGFANGQVEIQPLETQKEHTAQEIKNLKTRIQNAQAQLKKLNAEASRQERALEKAERNLGESRKKERLLNNSLALLQKEMHQTQKEIATTQAELDQQKKWIAEQLRNTYKYGQDTSLKLVFSGDSPSDTARLLKYHQKLHETRQHKVEDIEHQEENLKNLQSKQQGQQSDIKSQQNNLAQLKKEQETLKANVKRAFDKAQASVKNQGSNISRMQNQSKLLEALLADILLQEELEKAKARSTFSKKQGDLKLPLIGEVVNTYDKAKSVGNGTWRGIWIKPAHNGNNDVKSIAEGHVVFADWLLGYGLITIVDHGQGFFSLYGQTQALLKQPGDWVNENDTIALLNPDDMNNQPVKGLYFELRKNNDTLNPIAWLKKNR